VPAFIRTILDTPDQQIKAYKAKSPGEANTLFASDARQMATNAWHVQSQDWASEAVSMSRRFVWGMAAGSRGGTLTVTYTR
jgi:hypothetical protein